MEKRWHIPDVKQRHQGSVVLSLPCWEHTVMPGMARRLHFTNSAGPKQATQCCERPNHWHDLWVIFSCQLQSVLQFKTTTCWIVKRLSQLSNDSDTFSFVETWGNIVDIWHTRVVFSAGRSQFFLLVNGVGFGGQGWTIWKNSHIAMIVTDIAIAMSHNLIVSGNFCISFSVKKLMMMIFAGLSPNKLVPLSLCDLYLSGTTCCIYSGRLWHILPLFKKKQQQHWSCSNILYSFWDFDTDCKKLDKKKKSYHKFLLLM